MRVHIVFVVIAVGLFSLVASAQVENLSAKDFNVVWIAACEKTKGVPHVQTETDEKYYDEVTPPYNSYISVTRYIPLDRVWTIAGRKDSRVEDKYEEIRIGRNSYSRDGNAEWKKKLLGFSGLYSCEVSEPFVSGKGSGAGSGNSDGNTSFREEHKYKYLGREEVGKKWTNLYVHTKTNIFSDSQFTVEVNYWITDDGTFLKSESATRNPNSKRWDRQLREYDYDQKDLKIEVPIK